MTHIRCVAADAFLLKYAILGSDARRISLQRICRSRLHLTDQMGNQMKLEKLGGEHQAGTELGSRMAWMQINIGTTLRGQISEFQGHRFLEADLNQQRWTEAGMLAANLARALEIIFGLSDGGIYLRMRYVEIGNEQVQPQIHLCASGRSCDDNAKLKAVLTDFCAQTTANLDLYDLQKYHPLATVDAATVSESADNFLQASGGKRVGIEMQLVVADVPVATISGYWRGKQASEPVTPTEKTIEGLYDGRRFRMRTLYLFVTNPRPRSIEIFYDEQQFDDQLRKLEDNKTAMLSLTVSEEIGEKGQISYELVSLTRIEPPELLVLT